MKYLLDGLRPVAILENDFKLGGITLNLKIIGGKDLAIAQAGFKLPVKFEKKHRKIKL